MAKPIWKLVASGEEDEHSTLYGADADCQGEVVDASGGGVRCVSCNGWFCY